MFNQLDVEYTKHSITILGLSPHAFVTLVMLVAGWTSSTSIFLVARSLSRVRRMRRMLMAAAAGMPGGS